MVFVFSVQVFPLTQDAKVPDTDIHAGHEYLFVFTHRCGHYILYQEECYCLAAGSQSIGRRR